MQAYADPESALDRAFERLYRRYVKDVYRYTLAVLRNPADAEDVTQTTFLNAYRAFKRGEKPLKPHHWLIKIAHNACRSRYVRTARRPVAASAPAGEGPSAPTRPRRNHRLSREPSPLCLRARAGPAPSDARA